MPASVTRQPCEHGEIQIHPHGRIYCPKCRKWGGIYPEPASGVVEAAAYAIFGKGYNGAEAGYAAEYVANLIAAGYSIVPPAAKTR